MSSTAPDTGSTQPTGPSLPLGALIGIIVMALVGVGLLAFALITLFNSPANPPAAPSATPALVAVEPSATSPILIPTVTAPPPASDTPAPTDTAAAADTAVPATAAPTGPVLTISLPANVRAGPGTNYGILGGLDTGSTPEVVGRDSSATWYVITYLGGRGWVSNQVAQYTGDINALPVVTAPPPPPTATPIPPTATARPAATSAPTAAPSGNALGIRVDYFYLTNNITQAGIGQAFQFRFKITNVSGQPLTFGGMGAIALPGGPAQPSWSTTTSGQPVKPNEVLEWEDNMTIRTAGTYKIHLGICFLSSQDACENPAGWTVLSSGIDLVVR